MTALAHAAPNFEPHIRTRAPTARRPFETIAPAAQTLAPEIPDRDFEAFRRDARDLGVSGVHPRAVVALLGGYGALMTSFWLFFGGPDTALTLGVITVLGVMFFGMLGGGILLSDSVPRGQHGRDFGEFLAGRALTFTGWVSGKEALAQIIILPISLVVGSMIFGTIWRLTAG